MLATGVRLVIGEGAAAVRRSVGPTSWAALEVLASHAQVGDGVLVVTASVRLVADELRVATNTAHRAVRRLVETGLVVPMQDRATDGRFLTGGYRLTVGSDVLAIALDDSARPSAPSRQPSARRAHQRSERGTQLDLLASCD